MLRALAIVLTVLTAAARHAEAAELVMVEEAGCLWCARFNREVGPIYSKTAEAAIAPLRRIDIRAERPDDVAFAAPLRITPTFVLVEEGRELSAHRGVSGREPVLADADPNVVPTGDQQGMKRLLAAARPARRCPPPRRTTRLVDFKVLTPDTALRMAQAAMSHCRDQGYQVGVTVVDRSGVPQVFLRDRFAGLTPPTPRSARRGPPSASAAIPPTSPGHAAGEPSYGIRQLDRGARARRRPDGRRAPVRLSRGSASRARPHPSSMTNVRRAGIDEIADEIAF